MTLKEMLKNLNSVINKVADLEINLKEAMLDCRRIVAELEEFPGEPDDLDKEENDSE